MKKNKLTQLAVNIASCYFDDIEDLFNLEIGCPSYRYNIDKFYYNPFSIHESDIVYFKNLETLYKKISTQLDELDIVFQKFLNLVLGTNANNYVFEFEKDVPLSNKEKLDVLTKLHAEGFSVKAIIDMISGIDFESYVKQSMIEQESNMYDVIKPPLTSYTATSSDLTDDTSGGREKIEEPDNEETIRTQEKSIADGSDD